MKTGPRNPNAIRPSAALKAAVRPSVRNHRSALAFHASLLAAGFACESGAAPAESAFPPVFELAGLAPIAGGDGSDGFVVLGPNPNFSQGRTGNSISGAGDVNGDGVDDFIIGAFLHNSYGQVNAGESYVVFGQTKDFQATFALRGLYPAAGGDGSTGFVLSPFHGGHLGRSVSHAGDVNGDGIDDLIVGAPSVGDDVSINAGETYVVFGRTTGFPAAFDLGRLTPPGGGDGSEGFILKGPTLSYSGASVSGTDDVNGDGIDDLLVAAPGSDPHGLDLAGETYVVFGRTTGFPPVFELRRLTPEGGGDGSAGFVIRGINPYDSSGDSASAAGDVNGDGLADLIIGSSADPQGHSNAGASFVVFGRTTGFPAGFELRSLTPAAGGDGSEGFIIEGIDAGDYSALSVNDAGDVNGDGIDDVIIDAQGADPAGEVYVVFGRTTGFPAEFELRILDPAFGGDGSAGFIMTGIKEGGATGNEVAGAGDVNADGVDDVIIGAPAAGPSSAGQAYIVFGHATGFPPVFELRNLAPFAGGDGSAGFIANGFENDCGDSVSGAGDVNGDGIADLLIADTGARGTGDTYVVFGRPPSPD